MVKKKKQPEKKYRITLTEHQLRLIANCVEDCHRFMAGQMELSHSTCMVDAMHELHEKLRDLKYLVTPHLSYGASYVGAVATVPMNTSASSSRKLTISTARLSTNSPWSATSAACITVTPSPVRIVANRLQ